MTDKKNTEEKMQATINRLCDLTNLDPLANADKIKRLADTVLHKGMHSACVRPSQIPGLMALHKPYRLSAVVGFPREKFSIVDQAALEFVKNKIGKVALDTKRQEASKALEDGAIELDPVIEIGHIASDPMQIQNELQSYLGIITKFLKERSSEPQSIWLKPIFSCELLSDEEIEKTTRILSNVSNSFYEQNPDMQGRIKIAYKNSTGYITSPEYSNIKLRKTSPELIGLIAKYLDQYDTKRKIHIKAAGGIRDVQTVLDIQAAAGGRLSHIGTSGIKSDSNY